jgi:hypothetical protein
MSQMPIFQPNYESRPPGGPPSSGFAITSMVLGIVSLTIFCAWYVSFPCAIVAIVLGAVAKTKIARGEAGGGGMANAGIVCGIIAVSLGILLVVGALSFMHFVITHPPVPASPSGVSR